MSARPSSLALPRLGPGASLALTVVRRVLIVVVMAVILVRPGWGEARATLKESDLDVLVVVDRTRSMDALDGPDGKPRLDLAVHDVQVLARQLPGARFGAITFGGRVVRLQLPFTTDTSALDAWAQTIEPEGPFDGAGSRIDSPIETMRSTLSDDRDQYPDRRRIVVFVSDGENTAPGAQDSFAPLKEYLDGGVVLGYGTTAGGRMRIDDERPGEGFMTDPEGGDAISHADPDNLADVAQQLGVDVRMRAQQDDDGLADVARSFKSVPATSGGSSHHQREITWLFGILLVPLLIWELWPHRRTVREVRGLLR